MTVLITMAGLGSRFARAGYQVPKYKVMAHGRTLFDWSLRSLLAFRDQPLVLATMVDEEQKWLVDEAVRLGFSQPRVVQRQALSSGQAETAYDALSVVDDASPLWIYNIDTYVAHGLAPADLDGMQGCVHVFPSSSPSMSYVRYGDGGLVVEVAEKRVISAWATVGMYGFASARLFAQLYKAGYTDGQVAQVGGERYIAPLYALMVGQGALVAAPQLAAEHVHVLGTPGEVQAFDPLALPPAGHC